MEHSLSLLTTKKNILFVTAHPDDSAIMLGGTIQLAIELLGAKHIFAAIATNGEAGENHLPAGNEDFVKNGHRKDEERAGLELLGIQNEHIFFAECADGKMNQEPYKKQFGDLLLELCQQYSIDTIVTLGPQNDGHSDHIATHEAAVRAAQQIGDITVLELNGKHNGTYINTLTPEVASRKFAAASRHTSQYTMPNWLTKENDSYSMGPEFGQASPFYPPLAMHETFDSIIY
jgi:LmbE family N-acetylglucosaminyl deacetylase